MSNIKQIIKAFLPEGTILRYHRSRAKSAASFYRFPASRLRVIGITGTDGKTTTAHFLSAILAQAKHKVAMATTIDFQIGSKITKNTRKMTTIDPWNLQKFIWQAARSHCQDLVLEVSAHAITQYRVWGIPFEAVILTNVTHDHLDYFQTFKKYRTVKEKLFSKNPYVSVINADDPSSAQFLKYPAAKKITYGIEYRADLMAKKILLSPTGVTFTLVYKNGQIPISLNVPGQFNIYNALAAASYAYSQDISMEKIKAGLESIKGVAGRMETIDAGQNFDVLIDYAHTPDALKNVYETVKSGAKGRLIAVLGSAGDRDQTKRPILGEIAARLADLVVVTNEDPGSEDPETIIDQIISGLSHGRKPKTRYRKSQFKIFKVKGSGEGEWWWRIPDRREAIKHALSMARSGDVVIITGKGAEEVMVVGNKQIPWSDHQTTRELLKELLKSGTINSRSINK